MCKGSAVIAVIVKFSMIRYALSGSMEKINKQPLTVEGSQQIYYASPYGQHYPYAAEASW